jgi:hypothetical protein
MPARKFHCQQQLEIRGVVNRSRSKNLRSEPMVAAGEKGSRKIGKKDIFSK